MSQYKILFVHFGNEWRTIERILFFDIRMAIESGHDVQLYCYRDSVMDLMTKDLNIDKYFHCGTFKRTFGGLGLSSSLKRLMNDGSIDLVHVYQFSAFWPVSVRLQRKEKPGLVLSVSNPLEHYYFRPWHKILGKRLDALALSQQQIKANIRQRFPIHPTKIDVVGMGFAPDKDQKMARKGKVFGTLIKREARDIEAIRPILLAFKHISLSENIPEGLQLHLYLEKPWSESLLLDPLSKELNSLEIQNFVEFKSIGPAEFSHIDSNIWIVLPQDDLLPDHGVWMLLRQVPLILPRSLAIQSFMSEWGKVGETYNRHDSRELSVKYLKILNDLEKYQENLNRKSKTLWETFGGRSYTQRLNDIYEKALRRRKRVFSKS